MTLVSPCCGAEVHTSWLHPGVWACVACDKPCDPVEQSEYHVRFVQKLRDEWDGPVERAPEKDNDPPVR